MSPRLRSFPSSQSGFGLPDLLAILAVLAVLAAIVLPIIQKKKAATALAQCVANLKEVNRATLMYAEEHKVLPAMEKAPAPGPWWFYKDQVKGYLNLNGPSSSSEKIFGCPSDRGYGENRETPVPFRTSKKHNFTSYVFNGVNLPGIPNVAGLPLGKISDPPRTLVTMEWTAHAPLSWHRSRTRLENTPFYNDAESVVGFADGHVKLIPIYYDGMNAAYTRDPIEGYEYKYGAE